MRDVRHAAGLSLSDVSALTGLHRARISELERGERAPKSVELSRLATAYGVVGWRVIPMIVLDEGSS